MSSGRATNRVAIDDERVRVTTWTFRDGDSTGQHRHEYDYVVVPVTGGAFVVADADGTERMLTQVAGVAYAGSAGTHHTVTNASGAEAIFVDIELKHRSP